MGMTRSIPPGAIGYKTREEAVAAWNKLKADKKAAKAAETAARREARKAETAKRAAERKEAARAAREAGAAVELARARELADRGEGGIAAVVKALAVGESYVAKRYTDTRKVSATLARIYVKTGMQFESSIARDIITGEGVIGVRITRVA